MSGEEGFYDLSSPVFPQQGDIFPNLPLIHPPTTSGLIILRELDGSPWVPRPGQLQASSEQFLSAFDDVPEYVAVSAERGMGVILTQTCDLVDQKQWLICPFFGLEGTKIDVGNLFADKYANLFGMPKHPLEYFETGYLDLARCFIIRREVVSEKDRIASLSTKAQHALTDKLSQTLTRPWGYSPGEPVPTTGKYRCLRCFQFLELANEVVEFHVGEKFGECADCLKIKKRAQWRILRKHEKY